VFNSRNLPAPSSVEKFPPGGIPWTESIEVGTAVASAESIEVGIAVASAKSIEVGTDCESTSLGSSWRRSMVKLQRNAGVLQREKLRAARRYKTDVPQFKNRPIARPRILAS
jgi:hypothetical protein